MVSRQEVEEALWSALEPFGLGHATDGLMDSLETITDFDDEEEF